MHNTLLANDITAYNPATSDNQHENAQKATANAMLFVVDVSDHDDDDGTGKAFPILLLVM